MGGAGAAVKWHFGVCARPGCQLSRRTWGRGAPGGLGGGDQLQWCRIPCSEFYLAGQFWAGRIERAGVLHVPGAYLPIVS